MSATARAIGAAVKARPARFTESLISLVLATALADPFTGTASLPALPRPRATHVQPTVVGGDPTCSDLLPSDSFLFESKLTSPKDLDNFGLAFDGRTGKLDLDVHDTTQGQAFDFSVTGDFVVVGVVAKGGPTANFYDYSPTGEVADPDLHAPVDDQTDKYHDLSRISFCLGETAPGAIKMLLYSTKGHRDHLVKDDSAAFVIRNKRFVKVASDNGSNDTNGITGVVCVEDIKPGRYRIREVTPPDNYGDPLPRTQDVVVVSGTKCTKGPQPRGSSVVTFRFPPLTDISLEARSQEPNETRSTIVCFKGDHRKVDRSGPAHDPAKLEVLGLEPGTYDCRIGIDP
ncbi:hypothetical protein [Streptomyces sp. NK08204]|uniref:hypothetical protein n=1 Tax=Streptomyces sp. NK08204 TaxID=2873260 RepID=UPI001CEC0E47|nr:hypothetical protein [Streptomyces sp. NK08204]